MNKTAIKNFAVWARNKLIQDAEYKAKLVGVDENGIQEALPQSVPGMEFYDVGLKEPYAVTGEAVRQRKELAEKIRDRAADSDYQTAYRSVMEETAYTWFNRLIAVRFMEVNDYLPSHIRVLSSESADKREPDLVTYSADAGLSLKPKEEEKILRMKQENQLDQLFQFLFVKQCNALNEILPKLFEKTNDYTEFLMNLPVTDKEGVVYHLVHDIAEDDFNIEKGGQVEIIGWLYQYYNTEPKDEVFSLLRKNVKVTRERIPAATQLFTPDWIVRYMVENSLGRLWLEGHPNDELKKNWKYYLDEAEQEEEVQKQLDQIRMEYREIRPEDIKVIDPCMGSGHILVYAFDVLMQIYKTAGYNQREAAKNILQKNLYGLDIDNRAFQLAYFAVMMKARQYNRRILDGTTDCHVYAVQESNSIRKQILQSVISEYDFSEEQKNTLHYIADAFQDAKEYGSLINIEKRDYEGLCQAWKKVQGDSRIALEFDGINLTEEIRVLIQQAVILSQPYDAVITNPPYMGRSNMDGKLSRFVKTNYSDSKSDLFACFIERCRQFTRQSRFQAMITQHAWMFLSSFERLREKLLETDIVNMAHLGARAFDEIGGEVVQTTAFVLRKSFIKGGKGTYCRLVEPTTQKGKEELFSSGSHRYEAKRDNFSKIPGSPIAYWVNRKFFNIFTQGIPLGNIADSKQGLHTGDNNKFIRQWYEVNYHKIYFNAHNIEEAINSKCRWFPYNKGGEFRKWYGNNDYIVNWGNNGSEIRSFKDKNGKLRSRPQNIQFYFKQNFSWSAVSSGIPSFRYKPFGHIFDTAGMSCFTDEKFLYLLALCNTRIVTLILQVIAPTISYQCGDIAIVPVMYNKTPKYKINIITQDNISLSKQDWDAFETSWDFVRHPLIRPAHKVEDAYAEWEKECKNRFDTLKANEEELNRIFIEIYGLQDELTPEEEDKDVTVRKADLGRDIRSLISYAAGCMFGRYSLDMEGLAYAGGDWDDGRYKTFLPCKDNIIPITDEDGYLKNEVTELFCAWVKEVYGAENLEENLSFIAKALEIKGRTSRDAIRNYFLRDFFKDHCKIYKKRPIYWLFDSGKQNGFKALIYMHRYDENTIGNVRIDYLHQMQRIYENESVRMKEQMEDSTSGHESVLAEKRWEKLQKQMKECREYDEKISHLAVARISIDLDDGVKVNYEKVQTGADSRKYPILADI
jgi:hypothetical protein